MSEKSNAKLAGLARARRSDPATSLDGAQHIERKGKASTQRHQCLEGLDLHPDVTPYELAAAIGVEGIVPGKRLPELRKLGLAIAGAPRVCKVRGAKARTWRKTNALGRADYKTVTLPGFPESPRERQG